MGGHPVLIGQVHVRGPDVDPARDVDEVLAVDQLIFLALLQDRRRAGQVGLDHLGERLQLHFSLLVRSPITRQ